MAVFLPGEGGQGLSKELHNPVHYKLETGGHAWNWILRMVDYVMQNITLNKAEFMGFGALSHDTGCITVGRTQQIANTLPRWIVEK